MAHRHLILAYVMTCAIQLGYAGFLGMKWRALRRLEREQPGYGTPPGSN
jgi:hypothetical protein